VHHRRGLRRLLKDDALVAAVEADWSSAAVSDKRRAMLGYAIKLTTEPGEMNEADIDNLRAVGFTDRDILDIVEVVSYYAYVNRIADALGVPVEGWIHDD
jgi:uncharacterized peroxidase-related enzyme